MIYKEENKGTSYQPIAAGSYPARCYKIIYLGTQKVEYMGRAKEQLKMKIVWELPTEKKVFKEGEPEMPYTISKTYTISLYEKSTLRHDLAGWRGNDFTEDEIRAGIDFDKLIGVSCLLSVTHKATKDGKTFALISSISRLPKGMECPPAINKPFIFDISKYTDADFGLLNKFDQDKVRASKEYAQKTGSPMSGNMVAFDDESLAEDEVPF